MIVRLAKRELETEFGSFIETLYYDGRTESIALTMGEVGNAANVLCRIHSACVGGHVFNSIECTCREEMAAAQRAIRQAGIGVIIYLDQEGKGNGHLALIESIKYKREFGQAEAYVRAGYQPDARNYRPAAEILNELEVRSVVLLTGNPTKADELTKHGVTVTGTEELRI